MMKYCIRNGFSLNLFCCFFLNVYNFFFLLNGISKYLVILITYYIIDLVKQEKILLVTYFLNKIIYI